MAGDSICQWHCKVIRLMEQVFSVHLCIAVCTTLYYSVYFVPYQNTLVLPARFFLNIKVVGPAIVSSCSMLCYIIPFYAAALVVKHDNIFKMYEWNTSEPFWYHNLLSIQVMNLYLFVYTAQAFCCHSIYFESVLSSFRLIDTCCVC